MAPYAMTRTNLKGALPKTITYLAKVTGLHEEEIRQFSCLEKLREAIDDYNLSNSGTAKAKLKKDLEALASHCDSSKDLHPYVDGLQKFIINMNPVCM